VSHGHVVLVYVFLGWVLEVCPLDNGRRHGFALQLPKDIHELRLLNVFFLALGIRKRRGLG